MQLSVKQFLKILHLPRLFCNHWVIRDYSCKGRVVLIPIKYLWWKYC